MPAVHSAVKLAISQGRNTLFGIGDRSLHQCASDSAPVLWDSQEEL